jgi:molybdopterin synthase catalytic subunit
MIFIQREEADRKAITEMVQTRASGCVVQFIGVVRDNSEGKEVSNMTVEVYEEMARKQLEDISAECKEKFGVHEVGVVHRYGEFKVGDELVFIAISAGHRNEAFKACMYFIDELKHRVPIWKKEVTPDGSYWVEGEKRE